MIPLIAVPTASNLPGKPLIKAIPSGLLKNSPNGFVIFSETIEANEFFIEVHASFIALTGFSISLYIAIFPSAALLALFSATSLADTCEVIALIPSSWFLTKSSPSAFMSCWPLNILDISSTPIPAALANASCCITFIDMNSAAPPTCSAINLAAPTLSPFKAKALASSKFNCLPVNNSASISAAIESSKFKRDEAISLADFIFKPNALDCATAFTNAGPWPANCNLTYADWSADSSSKSLWVIASLLFLIAEPAVLAIAETKVPASSPLFLANFWNFAKESADIPANVFNLTNTFNVLALSFSVEPIAL